MKSATRMMIGLGILLVVGAAAQAAPDWAKILPTPTDAALPGPLDKVTWRTDLSKALVEALVSNRPMFVTFRCLPCKQCSAFDKDVLEGGPELDPLLKQFVTVRLISAKDLDFRIFPAEGFQDMDLSWWGYFLSPDGRIYGVFGGRDEVSDETRISKAALVNTLKRVLAHHYDPRRSKLNVDGPSPDLSVAPKLPTELPGYASWADGRKFDKRTSEAGCLHCHQVVEILRQPAIDAHTFDKVRDTEIWPLPENVGIKVDRDLGLKVVEVTPDSPAAKAGLKVGDELAAAGDRLLFSQTDFRGVLHRGPRGAGSIQVAWLRDGKPMTGTLTVADGWRKTNLGWRTSIAGGNIGVYPGFWPVPTSKADREKYHLPDNTMAVHPFGISPEATAAGMKKNDLVTAVGDDTSNLSARPFLVWFRMAHEPGDRVTFTVKDPSGQSRQITYTLAMPKG